MSVDNTAFIKWFNEVGKNDVAIVGGKGANLGEMTQAKFPVPNGFVVTSTTYFQFIDETGIKAKLQKVLENLDVNDSKALSKTAEDARQLILSASLSPEMRSAIAEAYKKLCGGKDKLVAVRSSATAEDLPEASFAGQQESYMNIKGEAEVIKIIQAAWSSLFEDRAVFYRVQKGFDHFKVGIAVPVQLMVHSDASGVMFTVDPISNDKTSITIEGAYGFGDAVVSGSITPDQFQVEKSSFNIVKKHVVKQTRMLARADAAPKDAEAFRDGSELFWVNVPKAYQEKQKLSDEAIVEIAKLGVRLEEHYQHPQDIEWAVEDNKVFIVQTRPITTLNETKAETPVAAPSQDLPTPVLEGLGASPGIAHGPVKIIASPAEIDQVNDGDVLVTDMTTPDYVPAMRRAVAVITNLGGRTSHAAIVSRELGIPAVVGTELATTTLKTGEVVTVDGKAGHIYAGEIKIEEPKAADPVVTATATSGVPGAMPYNPNMKTATKVYCNLGEPQLAEDIAKRDVDGVGLLRAEFMMANIGEHPRYMLENGKREQFIEELQTGLMSFVRAFDPRPVIYRTSDFRTNEFRGLKGGEKYEEHEENPMIGFRGVSRYIADDEVFKMELEAIKRVRKYHQNLWLMVPFVRTPKELIEIKKIMASVDLYQTGTFKLFIMVEVPSTVIILEQFIGVGIDGVSIGSNDLTQLILGVDRDNQKIANVYDERNDAVMWALHHVVKTSQKHGIMCGICGQAPSDYPEMVQKLVEWGITSISVSPDVIDDTRKIVREAEYEKISHLIL